MLLQCGQIDGVEIMLGRRITICPTCLSRRFETLVTKPQSLDDLQLITAVDRNPRLPTTPSFQRYQALRLGMTVAQALRRGVRRRDLREWRREGSVKIEERRA
ncbi:MAG TPA: hypothetical protein VMS08_03630 [Candidatus Saccharimonadia bacterium]|nr:hypothetical protein [Candidatus Saccharimonadia bacterium]